MDIINGLDKLLAFSLGNETQSEPIDPPMKPTPPSEDATFRDELGIEIFKTPFIDEITLDSIHLVAKPLSIHPEIASYIRVINGDKICYYSKQNAKIIFEDILKKYPLNAGEIVAYNNMGQFLIGNKSRDCFQILPINGGPQYIKGKLITTYPNMGYYHAGKWKDVEIGFIYRQNELDGSSFVEMTEDEDLPVISSDDVAIPIAPVLLIPRTK